MFKPLYNGPFFADIPYIDSCLTPSITVTSLRPLSSVHKLTALSSDQDGFLIIKTNSNFTAAGEMQLERQGFRRLGCYDSRAFIVDKSQEITMQSPYFTLMI